MKSKTNWPPLILWVAIQVSLWIILLVMVHTLNLKDFAKLLVVMVLAGCFLFTLPMVFKSQNGSKTKKS